MRLDVTVVKKGVGDITDIWCTDELGSVLALNRERRLHGHRFERIKWGATVVIRKELLKEALDCIDTTTLYGFLRRNECQLQQLVATLLEERSYFDLLLLE